MAPGSMMPMRGIFDTDCCARAGSGHAVVAPPSSQQVFALQLGVDYAVMTQDAHYLGATFREYLAESFAHHPEAGRLAPERLKAPILPWLPFSKYSLWCYSWCCSLMPSSVGCGQMSCRGFHFYRAISSTTVLAEMSASISLL